MASDDAVLDRLSVYSIRLLAADMVDRAQSGHLGAPFGCAPLANALWGRIMKYSPRKRWMNRDRFVLSNGHASALSYSMLHLTGHGLDVSMEQLKQFRQAGSTTPGHPEFRMTAGIEATTGPLGQGFANGVGMAIAQSHLAARFNREGFPLFDHYTYVLAGDGCLMEGIASEAASLAGHLKLHKLIVFYDDNEVTIDGKTHLAFSEDTAGVFAAKRWNVVHISCGDVFDASVYEKAVQEAKSQAEKPTIVIMKTTIGKGAGSGVEGTHKAHGNPYKNLEEIRQKWYCPAGLRKSGDAEDSKVADMVLAELDSLAEGAKGDEARVLPKFHVPKAVLCRFREVGARGDALADQWEEMLERYCIAFREKEPDLVADLQGRMQGQYLKENWHVSIGTYLRQELESINANLGTLYNDEVVASEPDAKRRKIGDGNFKHKAGRVYVSEVLKNFVQTNPAIIGGSTDLSSSCGGHYPDIQGHFLHPSYQELVPGCSYAGRYIHFGVREHAAVGILNGISSYAFLIPYSAMFTVFYQYALPAIRMASISKFPVLYIGTHDSIDLGEDGPTHQAVEVLPQLRAMPNLLVIRPADVEEVVGSFQIFASMYEKPRSIHQYVDPKMEVRRPVFLMTSRGELGLPYKGNTETRGQDGVQRGAYVLHDCFDERITAPRFSKTAARTSSTQPLPDIVLIGSGQDVALVMRTKEILLDWSRTFNERLKTAFDGLPATANGMASRPRLKVRIVSMPCWELFDEQDQDYQESVLLSNYHDILRIYVEKAATKNTGHDKYAQFSVLMPSYGLSGKAADVERKLEFTPEFIAAKVWSKWMDRGRILPQAGDKADLGMSTWVSHMGGRAH